ncbi:glycosyl transferase family 2 [Caldicellulosiruptor kronotskyensis 2002]|uniref:Glycosyl transferase family 2 n=1 Tax=Caldicellulosiruptor kronotskyensis (strain DSM 18902 / VKM B-2412 / 2002) TaxID=632348 RepID=E4SH58_CALK2|nr:glycosyltransferase family 2 protein [Caldicellulosiruptor kronotskyensis]ADQ47083.1 glycosyl transferase family 2 [Caldicellulosiruptor kronotskyensis 2002]
MLPKIYFVIPCYNEEEMLPFTIQKMGEKLQSLIEKKLISDKSKVVFVDDGSRDRTWDLIKAAAEDKRFLGVKLSRNCGHQNALMAGMSYAVKFADCIITLDADLQDDINVIDEFIQKYKEGYEIVYGVRSSRKTDTFFKRFTAEGFYKLMKAFGVEIVFNHADYRLMSKRAVQYLLQFEERNLFLRGMIPLIGLKSTVVYYERLERVAGKTKYPLKKMLSFAFEGITSFSVKPIKYITTAGFLMFLLSFVILIYAIVQKLRGQAVTGWTSLTISIWFIGGLQLVALGLIGEYIGKIYKEVKRRPLYFIEEIAGDE